MRRFPPSLLLLCIALRFLEETVIPCNSTGMYCRHVSARKSATAGLFTELAALSGPWLQDLIVIILM